MKYLSLVFCAALIGCGGGTTEEHETETIRGIYTSQTGDPNRGDVQQFLFFYSPKLKFDRPTTIQVRITGSFTNTGFRPALGFAAFGIVNGSQNTTSFQIVAGKSESPLSYNVEMVAPAGESEIAAQLVLNAYDEQGRDTNTLGPTQSEVEWVIEESMP
jgi:hypothetical protein